LKVASHQIQGTTWLLLYPNHTNPNSFAQTLRVFLPRLLKAWWQAQTNCPCPE
jgi:hypothetical protein